MKIALLAPKGFGKTTVGLIMEEMGFTRMSLADPIRKMLGEIVPPQYVEPKANKNVPIPELGGKTFRRAAQTLGTEWGREMMDDRIWLNHLLGRVARHPANLPIVVDDVRMRNEYDALRAAGFRMVRVLNTWFVDPSPSSHVSETEALGFEADLQIVNPEHELQPGTGDIHLLRKNVHSLLHHIGHPV